MKLADARALAEEALALLSPACERIQIAGSVRRCKPEVKDVELVAIPRLMVADHMFGGEASRVSLLDALIGELVQRKWLAWNTESPGNGPKYKRLVACPSVNMLPPAAKVDLFIADRDNFGNQLTIRTGDREFTNLLVTAREIGGLMPDGLRQTDGYLHVWDRRASFDPDYKGGAIIPCPDEAAYFAALGIRTVPEPESRTRDLISRLRRG
ncbi:MAG: hypothetical protein M3Q29_06520 [Chloroflexota bacterium]|nr:hypothetical protein [Chloroflexota bacterium]